MDTSDTLSIRDIALTAAVIVPATFVWIVSERLIPAVVLGGLVFAGVQYGYPLLRSRHTRLSDVETRVADIYESAHALMPAEMKVRIERSVRTLATVYSYWYSHARNTIRSNRVSQM